MIMHVRVFQKDQSLPLLLINFSRKISRTIRCRRKHTNVYNQPEIYASII